MIFLINLQYILYNITRDNTDIVPFSKNFDSLHYVIEAWKYVRVFITVAQTAQRSHFRSIVRTRVAIQKLGYANVKDWNGIFASAQIWRLYSRHADCVVWYDFRQNYTSYVTIREHINAPYIWKKFDSIKLRI